MARARTWPRMHPICIGPSLGIGSNAEKQFLDFFPYFSAESTPARQRNHAGARWATAHSAGHEKLNSSTNWIHLT